MEKNLEEECPICFEINGHNECILLDCCDKYIHKECFDRWLIRNNTNCIYCTKSNKYIDNFIESQNISIPDSLIDISNDGLLESNNYIIIRTSWNTARMCYICISLLFLFAIFIGAGLRMSLN